MNTKYQIFISSTYEDLKDERRDVVETILKMYHFPLGMEMFSADNESQWNVIQSTINTSDIYVLILGHRYGSLTKKEKISFTQKEFNYAKKMRKEGKLEILCFIKDKNIPVELSKVETDNFKKLKLDKFINEVKDMGLTVEWWKSADDLCKRIGISLSKTIHKLNTDTTIARGWVRKENAEHHNLKQHSIQIQTIADVNELWQPLMNDLKNLNSSSTPAERNLDLLGLTLYISWGQLLPWFKQETTKDWTINIYCISSIEAKIHLKKYIPRDWIKDAENRTNQVKEFIEENRVNLEQREVKINFHCYDIIPAVHGFRLGNGKIYMSMTHWSNKTSMLDYDSHPYEIINPDDTSDLAQIKRSVFENWLLRSKK